MAAFIVSLFFVLLTLGTVIVTTFLEDKKLREETRRSFGRRPYSSYSDQGVEAYFSAKQNAAPQRPVLDSLTWQDLDMDRIYEEVNACLTTAGDDFLYGLMHTALPDRDALNRREALMQELEENPDLCFRLRVLLAKVGRTEGDVAQLLFYGDDTGLRAIWVIRLLSVAWLLFFPLLFVSVPLAFTLLLSVFFVDLFVHYITKRKMAAEFEPMRYLSLVLWGCKKICGLQPGALMELQHRLSPLIKCLRHLGNKVSVLLSSKNAASDLFVEYCGILTLSELRSYHAAAKLLRENRKELVALYECAGELDAVLAILSYRRYKGKTCVPQLWEENAIAFTDLVHPLIYDPVANSAEIRENSLITGSNASGKTTFMKAVAVNCILAQSIHTCTAAAFALRPAFVVSAMTVRDDIMGGHSYYMAELLGLKRILDISGIYPVNCFIDEILRGTNRTQRLGAAASILSYLNSRDVLCTAATHDLELAEMLGPGYENYHFCEETIAGELVFDYKLKKGIGYGGNAIRLLAEMGFPRCIVEQAKEWVEEPGKIL